jgi:ATP-dependent RNA helicase DHX29
MLDEPPERAEIETNTTLITRSMPIPKAFSFSGNTPKMMLKAGLAKTSNPASVVYIKLSGHSRSVRVGLEISWSTTRRRVWRMDDIACDNQAEAENFVATLALNALSEVRSNVNWRAMPPSYRELWEELEVKRDDVESARKREIWGKIKDLVPVQGSTAEETKPIEYQAKQPKVDLPEIAPAPLAISERLRDDFSNRQASPAYQTMLEQRQKLPIASFRQQIIETLDASQVVVLSGETGCGKSTQLPAYILEDQLARGQPCKIYVTEPRRISAISLAQRVSQELGERRGAVGTQGSLVGYSIRLEAQMSASTRLAFVTNGIALRMLEGGSGGRGTAFDEVTHIVVDEVHERSIDSDFLLIVLKQLIQQRPDLKVVLMSATLDADKISAFFGGCPTLSVPGRTFPVSVHHLEDAVELARYHIDESSPYAVKARYASAKKLEWEEADDSDAESQEDPTKLSSTKYSASTVSTVNLLDSRQIPYDLIVRLLETICIESVEYQPFSAAVLIFMPGLAEIRKLNEMLQVHGHFGSAEYSIFPLHSTISSEGQGAVFDIPPPGVRKIVICECVFKPFAHNSHEHCGDRCDHSRCHLCDRYRQAPRNEVSL